MVSSRKRGRAEIEQVQAPIATTLQPGKASGLVHQIINMWQFANLAQYLFTFGKAVKIDEDIDIEVRIPASWFKLV